MSSTDYILSLLKLEHLSLLIKMFMSHVTSYADSLTNV